MIIALVVLFRRATDGGNEQVGAEIHDPPPPHSSSPVEAAAPFSVHGNASHPQAGQTTFSGGGMDEREKSHLCWPKFSNLEKEQKKNLERSKE